MWFYEKVRGSGAKLITIPLFYLENLAFMAQWRTNFSRYKMGRLEVSPSTEPCLHSFFTQRLCNIAQQSASYHSVYIHTQQHTLRRSPSVVSDRACGENNSCCSYLQWRQTPPNTEIPSNKETIGIDELKIFDQMIMFGNGIAQYPFFMSQFRPSSGQMHR